MVENEEILIKILEILKDENNLRAIAGTLYFLYSSMVKINLVRSWYLGPQKIKKVCLPPELKQKYYEINNRHLEENDLEKAVLWFAKYISEEYEEKDLINFYNNINKAIIDTKLLTGKNQLLRKLKSDPGLLGAYMPIMNIIHVDRDNDFDSIYHELFHLASSVNKNGIFYSGFSQKKFKFGKLLIYGVGVNEGYTELLAERFAEKNGINKITKTYKLEVNIAMLLEKIVGEEKMSSLYLNANLHGLIQELAQYANEQDIINFISEVDFLHNSNDNNKKRERYLKSVYNFLFNAYTKKLEIQKQNGIITDEEYESRRKFYYDSFDYTYDNKTIQELLEGEKIFETSIKKIEDDGR